MTRGQAERICRQRNVARELSRHIFVSANGGEYWSRCPADGNFVINGGSEQQRAAMLVRMLENYRQRSAAPIILLTGSDITELAVTEAAKSGRLGPTVVSSGRYPNYYPLFNMEPAHLSRLLVSIARQKGYGDVDRMESYINAFIAIAARYHTPSLESLRQLDSQYPQTAQLLKLGELAQVSPYHLEAIHAYPAGTPNLRNILNVLAESYRNITSPRGNSKFNLLTGIPAGNLMCVRTNSSMPDVMDLAMAAEIEQLLHSNRRFLLVLSDVPLVNAEGLYRQVAYAKNACSHINVGICTQNIDAWASSVIVPQGNSAEDTLTKNTSKVVHFINPLDSDGDVDKMLKLLGQYPKYEVQLGGGHGPVLFPMLNNADWHVVCVGPRNRVAPEDLSGCAVLLKGHDGRRIHLYRSINI